MTASTLCSSGGKLRSRIDRAELPTRKLAGAANSHECCAVLREG